LQDTVSYAHLYRVAKEVMEQEPKNLLETLAQQIASGVLDRFPVRAVRVRVTKTSPPIRGAMIEGAAIEIYRSRD
jgi:dihydroneopterin aldolase